MTSLARLVVVAILAAPAAAFAQPPPPAPPPPTPEHVDDKNASASTPTPKAETKPGAKPAPSGDGGDLFPAGLTLDVFGGGASNFSGTQALQAQQNGNPLAPSNLARAGGTIDAAWPLWFIAANASASFGTVQQVQESDDALKLGRDDPRRFEPFWRSLADNSLGALGAQAQLEGGINGVVNSSFRGRAGLQVDTQLRNVQWLKAPGTDGPAGAFSTNLASLSTGVMGTIEYLPGEHEATKFDVDMRGFVGWTWRSAFGAAVDQNLTRHFLGTDDYWFQGPLVEGSIRINGVGVFVSAPFFLGHMNQFELIGGLVIDEAFIRVRPGKAPEAITPSPPDTNKPKDDAAKPPEGGGGDPKKNTDAAKKGDATPTPAKPPETPGDAPKPGG